jgi:hypothetical protein
MDAFNQISVDHMSAAGTIEPLYKSVLDRLTWLNEDELYPMQLAPSFY